MLLTFNRPSIQQEVSPYDILENKLSGNAMCQIVFFFLSESFTAVGDEEKFELGKVDENIKLTSNEKQSVHETEVQSLTVSRLSFGYV